MHKPTYTAPTGKRLPAPPEACLVGVVAAEFIPEGQLTGPLTESMLQFSRTLRDDRQVVNFVTVRPVTRQQGKEAVGIRDEQGSLDWVARLQGARDRAEQNLELQLIGASSNDPEVEPEPRRSNSQFRFRLRATREIRPGEQLLAWFSDACAMQLGVPVLSVLNIRAHHCYQCHLCQRKFLHPNVLKAHLMHASGCSDSYSVQQQPPVPPPSMPLPTPLQLQLQMQQQQQQLQLQLQLQLQIQRGILEFATSHRVDPPPDLLTLLRRFAQPSLQPPPPPPPAQPLPPPPLAHRHRRPWEEDSQSRQAPGNPAHLSFDNSASCSLASTSTPSSTPKKSEPAEDKNQAGKEDEDEKPAEEEEQQHLPDVPKQQKSSPTNICSPPSAMDLPCDAEPLDLIPRSLYTCKSNKGHLCIYCGKVYSRKYGLKIHLRTHTGYKPLKCRVCLRPFGDPSNLNKHIRLHAEGDTPYRCEFCAKVLVRRRDLERHQRSRHPDKMLTMRK